MRLHRILPKTRAEGPGMRFTLWVQGCGRGCPGCYAKELWDPAGGWEATAEEIIGQIAGTPGIEGVTFLGGEPMEQAAELARVGEAAREMGLSVVTFTGFTREELLSGGNPDRLRLLACTDLLIDGGYQEENRDLSRPWVGSSNQRYLFLTDRYTMEDVEKCHNRVEFRLDRTGVLRLNGMGDFAALEKLLGSKTIVRGKEDGTHEI